MIAKSMRPPPEYGLRPATVADASFCWRLHLEAFGARMRAEADWNEAEASSSFQSLFEPRDYQIVVLDASDAGMLCCERHDGELLVRCLVLLGDRRGLGVGSAVLRDLLREAHSAGRMLRLDLRAGDWRVRSLCERVGLDLREEQGGFWRMAG